MPLSSRLFGLAAASLPLLLPSTSLACARYLDHEMMIRHAWWVHSGTLTALSVWLLAAQVLHFAVRLPEQSPTAKRVRRLLAIVGGVGVAVLFFLGMGSLFVVLLGLAVQVLVLWSLRLATLAATRAWCRAATVHLGVALYCLALLGYELVSAQRSAATPERQVELLSYLVPATASVALPGVIARGEEMADPLVRSATRALERGGYDTARLLALAAERICGPKIEAFLETTVASPPTPGKDAAEWSFFAYAWGRCGSQRAVPTLKRALSSGNRHVSRAAAVALVRTGSKEGISAALDAWDALLEEPRDDEASALTLEALVRAQSAEELRALRVYRRARDITSRPMEGMMSEIWRAPDEPSANVPKPYPTAEQLAARWAALP